jgi:hypothetical protein
MKSPISLSARVKTLRSMTKRFEGDGSMSGLFCKTVVISSEKQTVTHKANEDLPSQAYYYNAVGRRDLGRPRRE